MRKNREKEILNIFLTNKEDGITLTEIEQRTGISGRQIRNYIQTLNAQTTENFITQKNRYYKLCRDYRKYLSVFEKEDLTPQKRVYKIISYLLSNGDGIDAYSLAEELYISKSTLDHDIKRVKKRLESFQLRLISIRDMIHLEGSEIQKRRLASYLLHTENYENFLMYQSPDYIEDTYNIQEIRRKLQIIFSRHHIYVNDYSMNNIVIHLLITMDRIQKGYNLHESNPDISQNIPATQIAVCKDIQEFVSCEFDIHILNGEFQNLLLFVSCNASAVDFSFVNRQNIRQYISEDVIRMTEDVLKKVQDFYYLNAFDDVFFTRFVIHINNLLHRVKNCYNAVNPMSVHIKHSYPLIYDMAVFIANELGTKLHIALNEDEISFIAFHIGSFFETSTENKNKLTAIYVYMEYYDIYRLNLEKLQKTFHNTVDIRYALSIQDFEKAELVYDLIISELPLPSTKTYIQISPFISEEEIQKIQKHIQQYMSRKKEVEFEKLIQEFSNEELFFRNMKQESKTALLKDFTQQVISLGYADQSFISDVLTREKLSSTSFHNGVAIPHALHPNARKSFIAFLLLDSPILWDQDEVSIVILIGISYDQRKSFRQIFNHLVELLSRPAVVQKLASITEYKELLHTITAVDV